MAPNCSSDSIQTFEGPEIPHWFQKRIIYNLFKAQIVVATKLKVLACTPFEVGTQTWPAHM